MSSPVAKALITARQKCLSEEEAYWDPRPDFTQPISPRNEAAALSWLLDHQSVVCRGGPADVAELHALCAAFCARMGAAGAPEERPLTGTDGEGGAAGADDGPCEGEGEASTSGRSFEEASAEAALQRWCNERGLRGAASPALFGGGGSSSQGSNSGGGGGAPPLRGLRADSAVSPGDVVLHVPAELLISYDTARESDLGKVLTALPLGLGEDSIALIWSCVERREPEAAHAPFWAALPERFATLLSAPDSVLALLEGTPLHAEATRARQHLRDAFASSGPAFTSLIKAYPDYFKPEWFSWEAYLWAAELWYSYGIQVQFPDGSIRTCLAPYLGLMNHHPLPHVVHFSKVDKETGCLRVRAFRPCAPGRQLFLSYGPYPNSKLLLFYGFALPGNPADETELELQVPSGPSATDRRSLLASAGLSLEHRLRPAAAAPPGRAGLVPSLLATARLLTAPPEALRRWRALPPVELRSALTAPGAGSAGDGAAALKLLQGAIEARLRPALACASRLREQAAVAASGAGADAGDGGVGGEVDSGLRHFVGVYVEGLVQTLEDALAAVRPVQERG